MGAPHWICYELETMTDTKDTQLQTLVTRAASHPIMQEALTKAIAAALPQVVDIVMRDLYRGDHVRMYVKKTNSAMGERHAQIRRMLGLGHSATQIAAAIGCSERTVYRVAQKR